MTWEVRVGGVPEHFNLPWLLAIEEGAFEGLDVEVVWVDQPGGTGEIMKSLADGDIEMATPLTEGAVTAIAAGNPARIARMWVDTPLLWGVHVATDSDADSIDDLADGRFAISHFGSGSELMSRVLAEDHQWSVDDDRWVLVENLEGALDALPSGQAEIFLWNKSMTQPHIDQGILRRVGVLETPWPSFAVVGGPSLPPVPTDLAQSMADLALARAAELAADPEAADIVAERYGLSHEDAAGWLNHVEWAEPGSPIDLDMLGAVTERMHRLQRIDRPTPPWSLIYS